MGAPQPHCELLLQHSGRMPQLGHWLATQVHLPLWHCRWLLQVPQFRVFPQPSLALPQERLCDEQDFGPQHEPM